MSFDEVLYLGTRSLETAMLVAGPALIAVLIVGTLLSVIQTVTQVQEPTLVFVPKIAVVFLVLLLGGAWMLQVIVGFGTEQYASLAEPPQ